jgi:hypothetical protein
LAEGYLARSLETPKTIKYRTFQPGIAPGQTQHILLPLRDIDTDVVITDVSIRDYGKDKLIREVTATAGVSPQDGWRDVYKLWSGDKTGGSAVVPSPTIGTGAIAGGTAAPPFTSVQFNRSGAFGGDESFTYDENTNSVICGQDSTITSTNFESCQVLGYDNHITD